MVADSSIYTSALSLYIPESCSRSPVRKKQPARRFTRSRHAERFAIPEQTTFEQMAVPKRCTYRHAAGFHKVVLSRLIDITTTPLIVALLERLIAQNPVIINQRSVG